MGIRNLNRFIQQRCPECSSRIHLRDLSGKRIAVDTSIYMYRYSGEGALLENMYLMASVFRYYNIHAVFIFDGPPPPQKTDLIELRRKKKEAAKKQYDELVTLVKEKKHNRNNVTVDTTEIDDIEDTMRELKKQFVRLRDCDISHVKELLVSFGFATIDAEGEADVLCAKLTMKKRVDACLSDDTDMFVYGCPVVLRHISLLNHSVVSYDTREILKKLSLTQQELKMMCVVCGTDYTQNEDGREVCSLSPEFVYNKLIQYKSLPPTEIQKHHNSGGGFYDWYLEQQKGQKGKSTTTTGAITYIANESMFDIMSPSTSSSSSSSSSTASENSQYKQLVVLNRDDIQRQRIVEIMMKEDFIFVAPLPSDKTIIQSLSSGKGSISSSPLYSMNASSYEELHNLHKNQHKRGNQ